MKYTYLTIIGHPYNDLHPLSELDGEHWLDIDKEIVYVSD